MLLDRVSMMIHLRAIKSRGRPVALMLHKGRLHRFDAGSGMHERMTAAGAEWIGTYLKDATPEMLAEDMAAAGLEVHL